MGRGGHPLFARYYARASPRIERGVSRFRTELLSGLTGRVIEIGAGTGPGFAHYGGEVTSVLAVEPEPHLRRLAGEAARRATVAVQVVDGVAARLPAGDGSCDAAVVSLVLCTVPDQAAALTEIARVLRPGGRLCFFEHVRAPSPWAHRAQRVLDATVWPLVSGGCHTGRDTETAIRAAGFCIDHLVRLGFADTHLPFPASTQILGTATRAAAGL